MVAAWFMDSSDADQRLPHKREPNQPVTVEYLRSFGVLHFGIGLDDYLAKVNALAAERNYKNRDEIKVSKEKMGDVYEAKIKTFFEEHLHEDEEIRFCLAGSGYFDVRDSSDQWVRIHVHPGDLIILPAGIYHRFTLDEGNFIHAIRLFKEEPKWVPINRPADDNSFRVDYLRTLQAAS